MSEENQRLEPVIRRVVVALDASPCSRAVLRTAARISAALGAELEGLFVEDTRLLDLAELPIAVELRQPGGVRAFDRSLMEQELRVVAQTVEHWAGEIAHQHNATWRFRVVRGNIARSLMDAAGEHALLSLGRFGNPICPGRPAGPAHIGSVARRVLSEHRSPLLLLHQEMRPGQPVLVTTSGAAEERPLLAMAVRLAQVYASPLMVLTSNPAVEARLTASLAGSTQAVTFHRLRPGDLRHQILALSRGRGGLILSHRRDRGLEEMECAIILL